MLINLVCNSNEVEYELRDLSHERSISSVANSPYLISGSLSGCWRLVPINVKPLITHVMDIDDYKKDLRFCQ